MGTEAQNEANRRNAERSTGPRSEAGKKRASLNAVTHGLTARDAVIPGESEEEYEAFRSSFWTQWQPEVPRQLVERSPLRRVPLISGAEEGMLRKRRAQSLDRLERLQREATPPETGKGA